MPRVPDAGGGLLDRADVLGCPLREGLAAALDMAALWNNDRPGLGLLFYLCHQATADIAEGLSVVQN